MPWVQSTGELCVKSWNHLHGPGHCLVLFLGFWVLIIPIPSPVDVTHMSSSWRVSPCSSSSPNSNVWAEKFLGPHFFRSVLSMRTVFSITGRLQSWNCTVPGFVCVCVLLLFVSWCYVCVCIPQIPSPVDPVVHMSLLLTSECMLSSPPPHPPPQMSPHWNVCGLKFGGVSIFIGKIWKIKETQKHEKKLFEISNMEA